MTTILRWIGVLVGAWCLSACGALNGDSAEATLEVELTQMATQAASIRTEAQAERTRTVATIIAAETKSADYVHYNNILVSTVRAVLPPTQERIEFAAGGAMSLDMLNTSDGALRVIQVGTAGVITPQDNCFVSHQNYFTAGVISTIYLTGVAINLQPGTRLEVNWLYNNEIVFQNGFTASTFAERQCFAIPFTPANAPFSAGVWSAILYINGEQTDPAPFNIFAE